MGTVLGVRSLYTESWWGEMRSSIWMEIPTIPPSAARARRTTSALPGAWTKRCTPQSDAPNAIMKGRYSIYRFHGKDPTHFQQGRSSPYSKSAAARAKRCRRPSVTGRMSTPPGEKPTSRIFYYERSDDYCSTVLLVPDAATPAFPKLPDRAARMADLSNAKQVVPVKSGTTCFCDTRQGNTGASGGCRFAAHRFFFCAGSPPFRPLRGQLPSRGSL